MKNIALLSIFIVSGFITFAACSDGEENVSRREDRLGASGGIVLGVPGFPSEICGGFAGIQCPPAQYCRFESGTCGIADLQGTCEWLPDVCTDQWEPVCGCDDVTYSNPCDAAAAGKNIAYEGVCEDNI
jgi:hypothetical protein